MVNKENVLFWAAVVTAGAAVVQLGVSFYMLDGVRAAIDKLKQHFVLAAVREEQAGGRIYVPRA